MDRDGAKIYLRKYYAKRLFTIIPIVVLSLVIAVFVIIKMNEQWNPYMKDKEIIAVLDEAYEEYEFLDCFRFDISDDLAELICIVRNCDKEIDVGYICVYKNRYSHEYSYKKAIESMQSNRNYSAEGMLVNCIIDMKLYENKKAIPDDVLVMREIRDKNRKLYYCIEDVNVINRYNVRYNHALSEKYGKDNYEIIEVFALFDDADYPIANMSIIKTSNGSIDIGTFYSYDDYSEALFHILVEDMMVGEYYLVDSCTSEYHVGMALYDKSNIPDKTYKVRLERLDQTPEKSKRNAREYIEVPTDDGILYFAIDCLKYVPEAHINILW